MGGKDLIDILFLTCAAGYADIVLAERQAVAYLAQARTPRPKARLASSLTEAVALIGEVKINTGARVKPAYITS